MTRDSIRRWRRHCAETWARVLLGGVILVGGWIRQRNKEGR